MTYDFEWHARHGDRTDTSAKIILEILKGVFDFKSVLDVGCGDGRWLRQCAALGVETCIGVDGPWTDKRRLLVSTDSIAIHNLVGRFDLHRRFDLAVSLEVAEHIAPEHSEQFIANLVAHSDWVLFGAAIPYQGGFRHINERWQSYWAGIFDGHGYQVFDLLRNIIWTNTSIHFWYKQNMLTYVNRNRSDLIATVASYIATKGISQLPVDVVHPEKYEAVASYDQIAFRPLLKKLPSRAIHKARSIVTRKN
jgi:SAM-dependent methyltransferase